MNVQMISNRTALIADCFQLVITVLQILSNLVVLLVWISSRRLRNNHNLILLISLAFIDFLYACIQLPYLIYLIYAWVPDGETLNYNAELVVTMFGPAAALMKSGCTITTAIAVERIAAIYLPIVYYSNQFKKECFIGAFVLSILLALIDWLVLQIFVVVKPTPGCASFGCFTNEMFRTWWGMSNMVVNFLTCFLTVFLIIAFCQKSRYFKNAEIEKKNRKSIDKSANRVASYILIVSGLIGVLPNLLNGIEFFIQLEVLAEISFFVGTCASLSGLSHAFIFATAHRDIRNRLQMKLCCCFSSTSKNVVLVTEHESRRQKSEFFVNTMTAGVHESRLRANYLY